MNVNFINSRDGAQRALASGALVFVQDRYIAPCEVVALTEDEAGNPVFHLADGSSVTHNPYVDGDAGDLLYGSLEGVRRAGSKADYIGGKFVRLTIVDFSNENGALQEIQVFGPEGRIDPVACVVSSALYDDFDQYGGQVLIDGEAKVIDGANSSPWYPVKPPEGNYATVELPEPILAADLVRVRAAYGHATSTATVSFGIGDGQTFYPLGVATADGIAWAELVL